MLKKSLAMLLAALLIQTICAQSASASTKDEKQSRLAEKVKAGISKLGVGREARVEVKLQDKSKLAGYVSEINGESFIITNARTGTATTVAYVDVKKVKGHNLSTGAKIAIGVGIGVAIVVIALAIWWHSHGLWGDDGLWD